MTEHAHTCTQHSFNWEREILVQLRSSDFILTCVGQKGEKMVSRFLGWSYCPPSICCVWFLGYREGLPFNILGLQCKSSSASSFPCLFWGEVTLTPPPSSLFSEHSIDDVAQINSPSVFLLPTSVSIFCTYHTSVCWMNKWACRQSVTWIRGLRDWHFWSGLPDLFCLLIFLFSLLPWSMWWCFQLNMLLATDRCTSQHA